MRNEEIVFLILIAGRKQKDALLTALSESGVRFTNTVYGRGTVKAGYLQNVLGLVPEEHKVLITTVVNGERCDVVMKMLIEKFHFDRPNTGVAFSIPIQGLSF